MQRAAQVRMNAPYIDTGTFNERPLDEWSENKPARNVRRSRKLARDSFERNLLFFGTLKSRSDPPSPECPSFPLQSEMHLMRDTS